MCDKCDQTQAIIQQWVDQQGHDRCWYYPDLFRVLAELHDITSELHPKLPHRAEFEAGCKRYQDEEYN